MSDVMISYARADARDFAGRLAEALKAKHLDAWLDTSDIDSGAEWLRRIEDAIATCKVFIAVRTPAARESFWVRSERLYALNQRKPIIPLLYLDCSQDDLELISYQPVDFRYNFETSLPQLMTAIQRITTGQNSESTDQRTLEMAYLGRILLEHSVWQTVYTPMAGVARILQGSQKREIKRAAANIQPMFSALRQDIAETFAEQPHLIEQTFEDITEAVKRVKHLVVLGDPGAGKTTTLWKLAADYAEAARHDPTAPLPVLIKLGALPPAMGVREQLQAQLGPLSLDDLLAHKRLALLVDALNELPAERRSEKVSEVRGLVEYAQQYNLIAVVTCREQDYRDELDLDIQERVEITPLDPARIQRFCLNHLPEEGEKLFWVLAGGEGALDAWNAWEAAGATWELFWTAEDIPRENPNVYSKTSGEQDNAWRKARDNRSLLALARNPYMLYMMTEVYSQTGTLPQNRGKLFEVFTRYLLLEREKLPEAVADELQTNLAELAYRMQEDAMGTVIGRDLALIHLSEEQLYRAVSANLLDGTDTIRFTHQLLQEYFAARRLDAEIQKGIPAKQFWPPDNWWQPQGWEETTILLAGLYSDDTTPLIEWLQDPHPELAARCVLESGAYTPPAILESLRARWLPRLTDLHSDPQPSARAAIGRAVGLLHLDNRKGVGLREDGLLDIAWREVHVGSTLMGGDPNVAYGAWEGASISLDYPYWMGQYPITYAQYEVFVAGDGYTNRDYWTEAGWAWKGDQVQPEFGWRNPHYHISNHPVIGVTWYEAFAFCHWLTTQLKGELPDGWIIRLPTEAEWEKATRYPEGRKYPWGDTFEAERCNTDESKLGRTSTVGIFPNGNNPTLDIHELSGNVWEWCLSKWSEVYHHPEDNDAEGDAPRVVRGGSWYLDLFNARAASRSWALPVNRNSNRGFRVVGSSPTP